MARTTATAVREIIQTGLTTPQINAFIADMDLRVTEELVTYTPSMSADRLEIIERYLVCAMMRLQEIGVSEVSIGDVTERYQSDPQITDYLMRAAGFDPSGKVRANFLAPRPLAPPVHIPGKFRVGPGFRDDTSPQQ